MYLKDRHFPLVPDHELVVGENTTQMNLYDNEDLITNIRGDYQDKNYDEVPAGYQFVAEAPVVAKERLETVNAGKIYAEVVRESTRKEARARYLEAMGKKPKEPFQKTVPMAKSSKTPTNAYGRFSEQLSSDELILAEIKPIYQQPKNKANKAQKNTYDFLKTSRLYNRNRSEGDSPRQLELNLEGLEKVN